MVYQLLNNASIIFPLAQREADLPNISDGAGVEHHTASSPEGLGRNALAELGSHHARVTMGTTNLAPHHSELGMVDLFLGLVDICNFLANVILRVVLCADTINLQ